MGDKRCRILAWECCLENTIASAITPFVVAAVSTYFGFNDEDKDDPDKRIEAAKALGKSMTLIVLVPGICCFCVYSILHCTYERDVKRVQLMNKYATGSNKDIATVAGPKDASNENALHQ